MDKHSWCGFTKPVSVYQAPESWPKVGSSKATLLLTPTNHPHPLLLILTLHSRPLPWMLTVLWQLTATHDWTAQKGFITLYQKTLWFTACGNKVKSRRIIHDPLNYQIAVLTLGMQRQAPLWNKKARSKCTSTSVLWTPYSLVACKKDVTPCQSGSSVLQMHREEHNACCSCGWC